jgi:MFS family permease
MIQTGKAAPALPLIGRELEVGMVTAGWIASVVSLAGTLFGFAAGVVADRIGCSRALLLGVACLLVGSAAGALATAAPLLLAARFVEGVGWIAVMVAATPMIAFATAPTDRGLALGLWSAYYPVGMIVVLLAASGIVEALGWRALWLLGAALSAAMLAVFALATTGAAAPAAGPARVAFADLGQALGRGRVWLLAVVFLIQTQASFSLMTWLPTLLIDQLGRSVATAAVLTAGFVALFVPANILGGWLVRHDGGHAWLAFLIGGVGTGLLPSLMFADLPEWQRFTGATLYPLATGLVAGAVYAAIPVFAPSPRQIGAVGGIVLQGATVGALAGPPLLAAVVVSFGWSAAGWLFVAQGAILVGAALALRRRL